MFWPRRGVYFFFEPGEYRASKPDYLRVVRVGTHALKDGSRTTIWNRLCQHRGTLKPYGGNHRGSIFRLLAGQAIMDQAQSQIIASSWGCGSTASRDVRNNEILLEQEVSDYLGGMTFLVLPIPDDSGPDSLRGMIERNSIALLSGYGAPSPDNPSNNWLGSHSDREKVRTSGLWNNNHVHERYDPEFLCIMKSLIGKPI
jgi:hypothetical protein